jgi:uncharacterized protein (TIGR00369 family)
MAKAAISAAELERLARDEVPMAGRLGVVVDSVEPGRVTVRIPHRGDLLRPGGTVAGPVMMLLADFAMWGAVMSLIGPVKLAVTTSLNINFLRRPAAGDVVARASILKQGRRLAVGEVSIHTAGRDELVAHVTCTYSIPPEGVS